jgi:hypothetical protein
LKRTAGVKSKAARAVEQGTLPEEAARLLELLIGEIRSPADTQQVIDALPATAACADEARRFLKVKDRAVRREAFIKNERLWFNKYGWFMARIVILFGLLSFGFYLIVREAGVDFLTALILGAAGYYLLLVTLSNLRYREGNRKRRRLVNAEAERYQRLIVEIAADLLKRYNVSPERYPIRDPRLPVGLEQREEGYFIVVA